MRRQKIDQWFYPVVSLAGGLVVLVLYFLIQRLLAIHPGRQPNQTHLINGKYTPADGVAISEMPLFGTPPGGKRLPRDRNSSPPPTPSDISPRP